MDIKHPLDSSCRRWPAGVLNHAPAPCAECAVQPAAPCIQATRSERDAEPAVDGARPPSEWERRYMRSPVPEDWLRNSLPLLATDLTEVEIAPLREHVEAVFLA